MGLFSQLANEIKKIVPYDRISINLYDEKKELLSYFSTAEKISPKAIRGRDVQTFVETGQTEAVLPNYILAEAERRHIEMVLTRTGGRLGGKQGAATLLGIPRTTLQYRLKKHGIDHHRFRSQSNTSIAGPE